MYESFLEFGYVVKRFGEVQKAAQNPCEDFLFFPFCDTEAIKEALLQAYYGAGYQNIAVYIAVVEEHAEERFDVICDPEKMIVLDDRQASKCDAWWDGAEKAAKDDGRAFARIRRSRIQLRYYESMRSPGEFGRLNSPIDKWEEGEKLYDDMTRMGVTCISQCRTMKAKDKPLFILPANKWKA
ncbi:MAG: hypothetical protein LBS36_02285 [Oscillospiraceae bacterium]|nr:hypothetical protein [Oscillospiraceae bacterium]